MKPSLGRIVLYRSRTGNYTCPAMITAVTESLYLPNVEAGFIEPLSSELHVHLDVSTPGKPNVRRDAPDFIAREDKVVYPNIGGHYQEFDVEFWDPSTAKWEGTAWKLTDQPAGTWTWPPRA